MGTCLGVRFRVVWLYGYNIIGTLYGFKVVGLYSVVGSYRVVLVYVVYLASSFLV